MADLCVQKLIALRNDRTGATAIEYGLIIAIISVAVIVGMESIRDSILAMFDLVATTFTNASS
ncbi:hypothetical protein ASF69_21295 [Rhizobium sp. Leaf311]|nr:hypothetical protein ASF69_21295 [Rhizobium sp. Leaf311]